MALQSLDRLIRPKTIAVFGGKEAGRVVTQCDKMGFEGEIWIVHPSKDEILGRKCYRSVADLPAAPDAAFVGVNRNLTIEIIRQLAACGAGGAICYASGFREAIVELADGGDLQDELVKAAGDMRIIGPNCYGLINGLDGALLWPDQHGMVRVESGVAILTQSSNIALNLSMQARGLPIAYVLTAGNQAQTGLCELAMAVLEDPRVTAVALHVEGFDSIAALEDLAMRARQLKKPVITLKVGKSDAARKAAVSHTASLAGNHAVSSAILKRLGIGMVESLPTMIETLKLLHVHGPLESRDISSMSCSGGEASLMSDSAVGRPVNFRALRDFQFAPLRQSLGEMVALANPLDYHTFVWGDEERQTAAFTAMMQGGYALNLIVLDFPRSDRCDGADWMKTVNAMLRSARATGAKAGIVASLGENLAEDIAFGIIADGMVPFCGIEEALDAAAIAADIGLAWSNPAPEPLLNINPATGEAASLSEYQSKQVLAGHGLPVPNGLLARGAEEAARVAAEIGFPVALKGSGIDHKTEAGAVRLNLANESEVLAAGRAMESITEEFLVEAMAGKPVAELIIGAIVDAVAGPVLTVGAGGILVELLDDAAIITLPTTPAEINAAIRALRIFKLLDGYRGQPKGDIEALVAAIMAVAGYVIANAGLIEEIDINPLMVLPEGSGVIAADALIRMRKPA